MKTDFAELKEKLCNPQDDTIKYDYNYILQQQDMPKAHGRQFVVVEKYDELKSKSAAIISELIEIIEMQSNRMKIILNEFDEFMENKNNECDHSIDLLNKSLSETTTRLQKLREGNNGNTTN